jgi:hypothetical protein
MGRFCSVVLTLFSIVGFAIAEDLPPGRRPATGCFALNEPISCDFNQSAKKSKPGTNQTSSIAGGPITTPSTHLTAGDKFHFYLQSTYGPKSIAATVATSAIRQARNAAPEWGQGMGGYGKRFASSFGQKAIKQSIQFGIRALWHEDPRYRASARTGLLQRTFYAVGQTFVSYKDSGGTRFAYSRFIGIVGGVCISRQWHPENRRSAGRHVAAAVSSIGLDVANNVFAEFWPDIKRRIRR